MIIIRQGIGSVGYYFAQNRVSEFDKYAEFRFYVINRLKRPLNYDKLKTVIYLGGKLMKKRFLSLAVTAAVAVSSVILPVSAEPENEEYLEQSGSVITYSASNTAANPTALNNLRSRLRPLVEMTATDTGYMRLVSSGENIIVEYYDNSFNLTKKQTIAMELPVWGGFYDAGDVYYVVEGQNNTDGVDGTEVVRIIKYSKEWKRLGSGSVKAQEGWEYEIRYPFDYGCVSFARANGKLYIATGREGYVDPNYGQGHQGMMLIAVTESDMSTKIEYGNFGHSFAQYLDSDGDNVYILELSEGSLETKLSRYDATRTDTDYFNAFPSGNRFGVLDYGGNHTSAWAIRTYVSVDDLALSKDNILGVGTSIDQSQYDSVTSDTPHNIYLSVTPKNNFSKEASKIVWQTDYTNGGKAFVNVKLVKVTDDRFLLMWQDYCENSELPAAEDKQDPLSCYTFSYKFIDGSGAALTDTMTARGSLSDCHPIVKGSNVVFSSSLENVVDFYTINSSTGAFSKKVIHVVGETANWELSDDGVLTISGTGSADTAAESYVLYALSSTKTSYFSSGSDTCWKPVKENVTKIVIKGTIDSIGERAFSGFPNVTEVVIEDGVKSIGKEAFRGMGSLKSVTIPASVTNIGEDINWSGWYYYDDSHVYQGTLYVPMGSAAAEYAKKCGCSYSYGVTLDDCTIKLTQDSFNYTGSAIDPYALGKLSITYKGTKLEKDVDFTYTLGGNTIDGPISYLYISGKGGFRGGSSVKLTYKIIKDGKVPYTITMKNPSDFYGYPYIYISFSGPVNKSLSTYDNYFTLPSGLKDGKYTMKISPYSYFAPRTYEVTVKNGKLTADPDVTLYLRGDASCDGTINTLDLMAIKKHIINYSALKEPNLSCADLDVNGKVDLLDVSKLKKHLIGIKKLY